MKIVIINKVEDQEKIGFEYTKIDTKDTAIGIIMDERDRELFNNTEKVNTSITYFPSNGDYDNIEDRKLISKTVKNILKE